MSKLPAITVHGRFQPPLHVNHWGYINRAFELAEHVHVLITNPFQDEAYEATASWRNEPANNPFTYDERIWMFGQFFTRMGIEASRYDFKPFNIKDDAAFGQLDKDVPNLVNVYSEWSAKKVESFISHGLEVIKLEQPKSVPVSGTIIREIIATTTDRSSLPNLLVDAGFMAEAVPGLLETLAKRDA
jgi:nicotinamide mononucleotide adenylyltransferase